MSELMRIRPHDAHWDQFCGILRKTFNCAEPPCHAPAFRENYGIFQNEKLLAVATVDIESEISVCISNVAVDPAIRGQGIGGEMMTRLCSYLSSRFQKARLATQVETMRFYGSHGFEVDRYQPSAELQLMSRKLR